MKSENLEKWENRGTEEEAFLCFVLHDKVAKRHGTMFEQTTVEAAMRAAWSVLTKNPDYNEKEWEVKLIGWRCGAKLNVVEEAIFQMTEYQRETTRQKQAAQEEAIQKKLAALNGGSKNDH